ncbi:MAG: cysteine--tRNA ligase [Patescibacteria group bacterium]
MKLTNTLSGKKELLPKPEKGKPLRIFVCGPTVYDFLHIGNARTYLVFDTFVKYLRSQKIKVKYLQNITDIDDKIIKRAQGEKVTPKTIAKRYKKIYFNSMKRLGITAVDIYAPATKYIPQIIKQVKTLIAKKHVYEIEGDGYYFDITTFKNYGKLARRTVAGAEDGVSRIDESISKRNRGDFCVWKFSRSGEPIWKTDLGAGRPGWHIEDTAISEHHFGPQYEIHGAGVDLKFPHHEAEIAQEESVSGKKPFVKLWMHVGSLMVDGKKMSKSLGNFIAIDDFLAKYPGEVLRLATLTHHYRSPMNYTEILVADHVKSWNTVREFIAKLEFIEKQKNPTVSKDRHNNSEIKKAEQSFHKALADDFNTPQALGILFEVMGKIQPNIWELSLKEAKEVSSVFKNLLESIGLSVLAQKIPREIKALVEEREKSRANKQFMQSDALRSRINELGFIVEDTPLGPFLCLKNPS